MYSLRFCSVLFFSQPAHPSCLQIHCIIYFFSGSAAQLLSCHRWCRARQMHAISGGQLPAAYWLAEATLAIWDKSMPLRLSTLLPHKRILDTHGYWRSCCGQWGQAGKQKYKHKHKQSPTPIRAANGNGNSSSGWGRGRGRTGAATETLEMFLGLSVLVRLRARPANLLNGAKFFSISISISSCRLLTFCGCYSSCFCRCRSCCCCCCVCVCYLLPDVVVCVVRVAKYLHSNSIGCVLCLLPFARCCQNWKRWTLSQVFSIFSMSSAAQRSSPSACWQSGQPGELTRWTVHIALSLSLSLTLSYPFATQMEIQTSCQPFEPVCLSLGQTKIQGVATPSCFCLASRQGSEFVCTADIFGQVCAALKRKNHSDEKRWVRIHCAYAAWCSRTIKICLQNAFNKYKYVHAHTSTNMHRDSAHKLLPSLA